MLLVNGTITVLLILLCISTGTDQFFRAGVFCVFCLGGRGFVDMKEYGVPDVVKSMSWCGENICLGIRKEYMILNATNGALSEVFPSGRLNPPLVISLPSGELLLGKVLFSLLAVDILFS